MRGEEGQQRREDMKGLEALDITAATALWRGRVKKNLKVDTPKERWLLADLITGGNQTDEEAVEGQEVARSAMRVVQKVQRN